VHLFHQNNVICDKRWQNLPEIWWKQIESCTFAAPTGIETDKMKEKRL
jgi:hypothetical protein